MTNEQAVQTSELLLEHLRHWQGMRQLFVGTGVHRWRFRPKHHYLEHVALNLARVKLNPRCTACFQDEAYLGTIRQIAIRCNSTNCILRVFQRLLLNLAQRWHENKENTKPWRAGPCEKTMAAAQHWEASLSVVGVHIPYPYIGYIPKKYVDIFICVCVLHILCNGNKPENALVEKTCHMFQKHHTSLRFQCVCKQGWK